MSRIGTLTPLRGTEPACIHVRERHCRLTTGRRDEPLLARPERRHRLDRQGRRGRHWEPRSLAGAIGSSTPTSRARWIGARGVPTSTAPIGDGRSRSHATAISPSSPIALRSTAERRPRSSMSSSPNSSRAGHTNELQQNREPQDAPDVPGLWRPSGGGLGGGVLSDDRCLIRNLAPHPVEARIGPDRAAMPHREGVVPGVAE
jgi:hypothetical protein